MFAHVLPHCIFGFKLSRLSQVRERMSSKADSTAQSLLVFGHIRIIQTKGARTEAIAYLTKPMWKYLNTDWYFFDHLLMTQIHRTNGGQHRFRGLQLSFDNPQNYSSDRINC